MKNVFDRLSPSLQLILAQCSVLGFDIAALLASGTDGITQRFTQISSEFKTAGLDLKAILNGDFASLKKGNDAAAVVEAATNELQAQLKDTKSAFKIAEEHGVAVGAQLQALNTALASFGAKPVASDAKAGLTSADIQKSLTDRASILAGEQLAKHGLKAPLAVVPAVDATKAGAKSVSYAEFQAMIPGAKAKFLKEGGQIADGPSLMGR